MPINHPICALRYVTAILGSSCRHRGNESVYGGKTPTPLFRSAPVHPTHHVVHDHGHVPYMILLRADERHRMTSYM
jgi:hypothetical protein